MEIIIILTKLLEKDLKTVGGAKHTMTKKAARYMERKRLMDTGTILIKKPVLN